MLRRYIWSRYPLKADTFPPTTTIGSILKEQDALQKLIWKPLKWTLVVERNRNDTTYMVFLKEENRKKFI